MARREPICLVVCDNYEQFVTYRTLRIEISGSGPYLREIGAQRFVAEGTIYVYMRADNPKRFEHTRPDAIHICTPGPGKVRTAALKEELHFLALRSPGCEVRTFTI